MDTLSKNFWKSFWVSLCVVGTLIWQVIWPLIEPLIKQRLHHSQAKVLQKHDIEEVIVNKFEKNAKFITFSRKMTDLIEIDRLRLPKAPQSQSLVVLVGESGIGKTTSICNYAKLLREKGFPVYYIYLNKGPKNINTFLMENFETENLNEIGDIINKNYNNQNKIATLIVDNIHVCQKDGELFSDILTTLNNTFCQDLKMNVIMVSSQNEFAYKMNRGIIIIINANHKILSIKRVWVFLSTENY